MSDPLSFVPLALAAADGTIDAVSSRRLVAAGIALLQRTAPLVRALDGREAAILLPVGPQLLVALAACSGRAALLLEPGDYSAIRSDVRRSREIGALFTLRTFAGDLPASLARVLLDDAPASAEWRSMESSRSIDLSLHDGLMLEGDPEGAGSAEVALRLDGHGASPSGGLQALTHRVLLTAARDTARLQRMSHRTHVLSLAPPARFPALRAGFLAPLLAGGRVSSGDPTAPDTLRERVEHDAVTTIVALPETYAAIAGTLERASRHLDAPLLQHCIAATPFDDALAARWREVSAVPLERPSPADAPADGAPLADSDDSA